MGLQVFSITQQGEAHIRSQTPCQDASGSRILSLHSVDQEAILAAVADGVGSCENSQFGAEIAVGSTLQYLSEHLVDLSSVDDAGVASLLRAAFSFALAQIEADAQVHHRPLPSLDTTLTVALYLDDGTLWFGHIGDGGIVALYDDATCEMITRRHKGEDIHSVYPLRNTSLWSFGRARRPVASLVLLTDGVLDMAAPYDLHPQRVYLPLLGTAMANPLSSTEAADKCRETMDAFFASAAFRRRVTDDISFVALQNSDRVAALPEVPFDRAVWAGRSASPAAAGATPAADEHPSSA